MDVFYDEINGWMASFDDNEDCTIPDPVPVQELEKSDKCYPGFNFDDDEIII